MHFVPASSKSAALTAFCRKSLAVAICPIVTPGTFFGEPCLVGRPIGSSVSLWAMPSQAVQHRIFGGFVSYRESNSPFFPFSLFPSCFLFPSFCSPLLFYIQSDFSKHEIPWVRVSDMCWKSSFRGSSLNGRFVGTNQLLVILFNSHLELTKTAETCYRVFMWSYPGSLTPSP